MKVKTNELIGVALDWAVATAEGLLDKPHKVGSATTRAVVWSPGQGKATEAPFSMEWGRYYEPSTDWSQGGPIIEREKMVMEPAFGGGWSAHKRYGSFTHYMQGPTPLIAAMRCFVASVKGEYVDIPDELVA